MTITTVRGVRDILPEESPTWQLLEESARQIFAAYGYREIRTPLFEKTELFARAVGATSDIVEKEMYTFNDRGGDSLSLRPEGTASVVRSFIENNLQRALPWAVYYMGPMFRYERPQKGRFRQFHQMGCELFGAEGPLADAEMMAMIVRLLRRLQIDDALTLEINSLGCASCRGPYRERLFAFLQERQAQLCGNCIQRLQRNPLRILDCKGEGCRGVARQAPAMQESLCPPCADHFCGLQELLNGMELPYMVNPLLVRGLDYYTRTAFEVTTTALGAQNAVAAGGRYDGLVAEMGGQAVPAIGFAMGMERLALLLEGKGLRNGSRSGCYLLAVGAEAGRQALFLAEQWRSAGVAVQMDWLGGSLKAQLRRADRALAAQVLILGEQELAEQSVLFKDLRDGGQRLIHWGQVVESLRALS
ncbi:histidine--tRNA ligase [Candidatus Magnetaquicoccus inordinatus]|uniref:histidine--tRNA ligase n=1 Tax=Candidatus Magnetaquicoccus inordinatus TaxID=2496818 RepID=UPI00102B5DCB|nr:histidine--tRNA ligase [Candidatus Magnetaquicoccus inordinatus]